MIPMMSDLSACCGALSSVVKAILARCLFIVHTMATVYRVYSVTQVTWYWWMLTGMILMFIEAGYTLVKRKGKEWKWVSPCVLLYLLTVIPSIWILESSRLAKYRDTLDKFGGFQPQEPLSGIDVPIKLSPDTWLMLLEQSLLLIVILGRWLLPRGEISRNQLSQLLFVYIGMSSDIMELFYLFEEEPVAKDGQMGYAVLTLWSVSLLQFSIVLTMTQARKTRVATTIQEKGKLKREEEDEMEHLACIKTDTWSTMTTVLLQDAPFLLCRLIVMGKFQLFTYSIIFYTSKNLLVLLLQGYRLLATNVEDDEDDKSADARTPDASTRHVHPAFRKPVFLTK